MRHAAISARAGTPVADGGEAGAPRGLPAVAPGEHPGRRAGPQRGAPHRGLPALADRRCPAMRQVRIVVADGGSTDRTRRSSPSSGRDAQPRADRQPRAPAVRRAQSIVGRVRDAASTTCSCAATRTPPIRRATCCGSREPARAGRGGGGHADGRLGDGCFQRAAAWVVDTPLGSGGAAHRGGRQSGSVDHGHHAGFRLDWFRRIGGYDESFSHNEDAEFDHRLAAPAARIWLDAEIRLEYRMRDSWPRSRGSTGATAADGRGRCSSTGCARDCAR